MTQEILTAIDVIKMLCKLKKKYGILIRFNRDAPWDSVRSCAPYLDSFKHGEILNLGEGIMLFDTLDELEAIFKQTIYDDESDSVYAIAFDHEGKILKENVIEE